MRVLMGIPNLNGGGAERMAISLAAGLNRSSVETRLFVHERWGDLLDTVDPELDIVYQHEGVYRRRDLPMSLLGHIRQARDADIIIGANEGRASITSMVSAKLHRKPLILWVHTDWSRFSQAVSWRQRFALRQYSGADVIVACSRGAAEAFQKTVPATGGKIRTIYNGIAVDHVRKQAQVPLPEAHARIFDDRVVIAVGRLEHYKGLDYLISAHAMLMGRGIRHRLVILGSGPLHEVLQQQAANLGVAESVHFLGFQDNPFRFIARSTALCLASRFEGFSLVMAEALACGTPVVAADCPTGPRELLADGRYGLLVPPDDPSHLADGLERVLSNEQERLRLQHLSHERAGAFDLSSTTQAWAELIEEVCLSHPKH